MNCFTYPVLTTDESAYKEDVKFQIENLGYTFTEKEMCIKIRVFLSSTSLKKIIDEKKAYLLFELKSRLYTKPIKIYNLEGKENIYDLSFSLDKIMPLDNLHIQTYLLTADKFTIKSNEEMIDIYKMFCGMELSKNSPLAISNELILYYSKMDTDFITISKSKELEDKGLKIELDDPNSIIIKAGEKYCDAYSALKNNASLREAINNHILFITLYYTTITLKENREDREKYEEKKWYEAYEYLFAKHNIDIKSFLYDETNTNDDVLEIVQKGLGNNLEKSLLNVRRIVENQKGEYENED